MGELKSSSLNTRNWRGAIFRDPVPDAMELARKVAGVELSEADRALLTQASERARARVALQQIQETGNSQREAARARMSGRTIDETGRDINERQPEPEPIKTGWYWTGSYTVWVVGPTVHGRGVHYQTAVSGIEWTPMRNTSSWQRVHTEVRESMRGFGWRPQGQTH